MHELIYGGINSRDYKVFITNAGLYKSPEKRYKRHTVPGRNGDLLEDTGTFENVEVEYPFCVYENCDRNLREFIAALRRKKGYQRIDDTFHPEYYRMGAFLDEFEPKRVTEDADKCNGVLKFECLPQKFLTEGDEPIIFWTPVITHKEDSGDLTPSSQYDTMHSGLFSFDTGLIEREITVTIHCPENETVEFTAVNYDANRDEIDTTTQTAINGQVIQITYSQLAEYGSFYIEADDIDVVTATLECELYLQEVAEKYECELGEKITIYNPTGFAAAPLFEFYGLAVADITLKNYLDGELDEMYVFYTDVETSVGHAFLDCDAMYMYDDAGNNITNLLHIATARNSRNQSLVFPKLGTNKIEITPGFNAYDVSIAPNWLPIVAMYPRWWTV